jgi:signal transduction histidine kinase
MSKQRTKSTLRLPRSANIKLGLVFASVIVVIISLLYAHRLTSELKEREVRVARLFADALRHFQNAEEPDAILYNLVTEYTKNSGVPVILTDRDDMPSYGFRSYEKFNLNISVDSTLDSVARLQFLLAEMKRMDTQYPPEKITYKDPVTNEEMITNYVHYGDSRILAKIEMLPLIQILLGAVVAVIGYIGFSYVKRSEQSNIWVGMSKETAHQLGTPLSSILGWTEMLRLNADDPAKVRETADEIQKDIERLNLIAIRFSKIGSVPDLKETEIVSIISSVMGYLEDRLPRVGKHIRFYLKSGRDEVIAAVNKELFEWVMENLIKNAVEAIDADEGDITITISTAGDEIVVDVSDTGKGIDPRKRKEVFRPGYTTKSRGWGLGLSLAKRIIEDYHHGRLFVKDSSVGEGTTFRIRLVRTSTNASS